jgi:hypothetical protein
VGTDYQCRQVSSLLATSGAETHRRLEGVIDPPLEALIDVLVSNFE